ncbi:hypothetical protein LTR53_007020 [Teratosphaeriaceae sp. CCFEE 6253]|nr:hypothetical protein LTR53_007020 [Teratosphaeriaceae sp. CCFEE 6253]
MEGVGIPYLACMALTDGTMQSRVDYMVVHDNGDVHGWRSGGTDDKPAFWQDLGVVFHGQGIGDIAGFMFADRNGDGRDDFLHINTEGQVDTYINQRGHLEGLVPVRINEERTHPAIGADRASIRFGRVHESPQLDYLHVLPNGNIDEWQNTGHGGTMVKGDGVRYCDMLGHGRDDYVWMDPKGALTLFKNIDALPEWGYRGMVFAECDYVWLNPDTGDVRMHKNLGIGADGRSLNFDAGAQVFFGDPKTCPTPQVAVHFADIDGDGKADLLCVEPDGGVEIWLNTGPVEGT